MNKRYFGCGIFHRNMRSKMLFLSLSTISDYRYVFELNTFLCLYRSMLSLFETRRKGTYRKRKNQSPELTEHRQNPSTAIVMQTRITIISSFIINLFATWKTHRNDRKNRHTVETKTHRPLREFVHNLHIFTQHGKFA